MTAEAHFRPYRRKPRPHGNSRKPCSRVPCPYRSVPGLPRDLGLCPYHWTADRWGQTWADTIYLREGETAPPRRTRTSS